MSDPLKIVIGFDRSEVAAYHTLCNSILNQSSRVVQFTPLYLPTLEHDNLMWRTDRGSTDFAFSRFLTPYMVGYHGKALFLDCDMIVRGDIAELFEYLDPMHHAVACCKHDYRPANTVKFRGNPQTVYPRKLWSAVMLFNCASQKCRNLTPKYVNEASGADLHQLAWVGNDKTRIGEIPEEWHYIPGHSQGPIEQAKLIHYTEGGPWFREYRGCQGAEYWNEEFNRIKEVESEST